MRNRIPAKKNVNKSHHYIRLHLDIEQLDERSRTRLEQAGVECVQDGGAYRAYGIIGNSTEVLANAASQPYVKSVEFAAPPVGF